MFEVAMSSTTDRENTGEILQEPLSIISVRWKIPMFFPLPRYVDYYIESPSFTFLDADFYLVVYPNGESAYNSQGCIGLYVMKEDSSTFLHNVTYTIGIEKINGVSYKFWRNVVDFKTNGNGWGSPTLVKRQQLSLKKSQIASDGTLTIFCDLHVKQMDCTEAATQRTLHEAQDEYTQTDREISEEKSKEMDDRKATSPNSAGWDSFSQNMKNLLKEDCLCYITIKLKDGELRAHKIILAAHSPVFSAMFTHEMSEKNTGIIEICDFESNVFKEFLQYLCTGSREALSLENICELYSLAHKYDVKHLQEECLSIMISGLTKDNFCDIISLALKYEEWELTKEATNFFLENVKNILVLTKWQTFMQENTTVANELFIKTVEKR